MVISQIYDFLIIWWWLVLVQYNTSVKCICLDLFEFVIDGWKKYIMKKLYIKNSVKWENYILKRWLINWKKINLYNEKIV